MCVCQQGLHTNLVDCEPLCHTRLVVHVLTGGQGRDLVLVFKLKLTDAAPASIPFKQGLHPKNRHMRTKYTHAHTYAHALVHLWTLLYT